MSNEENLTSNEIKALRGGVITRVCVENGDPVGTADPLFELR